MSDSLRFDVDTSPLVRAVRALDQVRAASARTETAAAAFAGSMRRVLPAIAGIASVETVRRLVLIRDEWQQIGQRIQLAARNADMAAGAQASLFRLARETRTEYAAVAGSFGRMMMASRELGASQAQVLTVVRAISQAMQVQGATTQEAANAAQQLGQALAKGVLNGDELTSIMENGGRLADAIAQGLGVSVGQLKAMGAAGELTSKQVFGALLSQAQALNAEFSQLSTTFGGAMTAFKDSLAAAVGENSVVQAFQRLGIVVATAAAGGLDAIREGRKLFFAFGSEEQILATARASGNRDARLGQLGGVIATARASDIQRELARIQEDRRALLANPLASLTGRTVGATGFGLAGLQSGAAALQALGRGPVGFQVGTPDADTGALARAFRDRTKAAADASEKRLDRLAATIEQAGETIGRLFRDANDVDDEMRRRRVAAGLESGDPVLDSRLRALEASVGAELRGGVRGASSIESRIGFGKNNIVDASVAFGQRLKEEADKRAQEMRTLFTEQLTRGVQDGLTQPIARFLRTWQLNVKTLGDALRDALINAVSAALANALTRRLVELFERMSPKTSKPGLTTQLAAAFAGGGTTFGGGGGFGGLPIPGLRLPFGGGGGAGDAGAAAAKAAAKNGAATAAAGKSLTLGSGVAAAGVGIGVGGALGRARGTGAGVIGGAASGALTGALVAGPVGAVVGGLAGVVGGLLGGSARRRARRAEAEARRESSRSLLEDLAVRNAAASGDDSQAERLRLEAQQRRELAEIVKQFGERSREVAALRNTQAAELRALTDSALGPGTYLGVAGYEVNRARFDAGRPTAPAITGNTFNITVPEGTTSEQARALLDEFGRMATQQGLPASEWSRVQVS